VDTLLNLDRSQRGTLTTQQSSDGSKQAVVVLLTLLQTRSPDSISFQPRRSAKGFGRQLPQLALVLCMRHIESGIHTYIDSYMRPSSKSCQYLRRRTCEPGAQAAQGEGSAHEHGEAYLVGHLRGLVHGDSAVGERQRLVDLVQLLREYLPVFRGDDGLDGPNTLQLYFSKMPFVHSSMPTWSAVWPPMLTMTPSGLSFWRMFSIPLARMGRKDTLSLSLSGQGWAGPGPGSWRSAPRRCWG
jgi:hypothetical protein